MLGLLAKRLAFLRAVAPTEADAFSMVTVQGFDSVAVEDTDDSAGERGCNGERGDGSESARDDEKN